MAKGRSTRCLGLTPGAFQITRKSKTGVISEMFPDYAPSKKVTEPIFLGGPENREALFALVQRQGHADTGRIALASNLYFEIDRIKRHYRWQSAVCGLAGRASVSPARMKRYAGACGLHDRRNSATITP